MRQFPVIRPRLHCPLVLWAAAMLALAGCATAPVPRHGPSAPPPAADIPAPSRAAAQPPAAAPPTVAIVPLPVEPFPQSEPVPADTAPIDVAGEVVTQALGFQGVRYRYSGTTPERGFDCSGLVKYVFRTVAGIVLPRSSRAMFARGEPVSPAVLKPGDLVFFDITGRGVSHVGIYVGERRFVHATSSKTRRVMVSDMDEAYWVKRYLGARRIVSEPGDTTLAAAP